MVRWGANEKKRFPVVKGKNMEFYEILKAVLETEGDGEEAIQEFIKSLNEKGQAAAKAAFRILSGFKDEISKEAFSEIVKAVAPEGYAEPNKKQKKEKPPEFPPPKQKKQKPGEEEEEEEMKKAIFEEVRKEYDAKLEAVQKQADTLADELKKERDDRAMADWIHKAKTELSHYPGMSAEEIAKSLKKLDDKDPEFAKSHFEAMKKISDGVKKSGALGEGGSSISNDGGGGEIWSKIEKLAEGIVEKSGGALTREAAIAKALETDEGKRLYTQHEAERSE